MIKILILSVSLALSACVLPPKTLFINKSGVDKVIYQNEYGSVLKNNMENRHAPLEKKKEKVLVSMQDCPEVVVSNDICLEHQIINIGDFSDLVEDLEQYEKKHGEIGVYVINEDNSIVIVPYKDATTIKRRK